MIMIMIMHYQHLVSKHLGQGRAWAGSTTTGFETLSQPFIFRFPEAYCTG